MDNLEYAKMVRYFEGCKNHSDFSPISDALDMAISGLNFLEQATEGSFQPDHLDYYTKALTAFSWSKARLAGQLNKLEVELKVLMAQKEMEVRTTWGKVVKQTEAGVESKVLQDLAVSSKQTKVIEIRSISDVVSEMYKQLYHQKEIFVWSATLWRGIFKDNPI